MKVGDLVKVWWLSKPYIGVVLKVKKRTLIVETEDGIIFDKVHEFPKGHVGKLDDTDTVNVSFSIIKKCLSLQKEEILRFQ